VEVTVLVRKRIEEGIVLKKCDEGLEDLISRPLYAGEGACDPADFVNYGTL
jgi:hypothetical protein